MVKSEEAMCVCACVRSGGTYEQWCLLVWHTRTHHRHATTVKQKMKDGTVAVSPFLQRSLQCPYCPLACGLKQYLTMHLQAKRGQPKREARHNSLKVECKDSVAQLLECPSLRELRNKLELETMKDGELLFGAQLASFLKELFKLESPFRTLHDLLNLSPLESRETDCLQC
ncbi:hypothetical protein TRVL_08712 [Trypanosoma vivax]|nr:hypothetical protein TRVL_08712 [Trypanosoma vivax]